MSAMNVETILSRLSNVKSSMKAAGTYSTPGMSKLCQIIQNLAAVLKEQNKEIESLKSDMMSITITKLVVNDINENGYFEQSKVPNKNINTLNTSSCEELLFKKDILCKRLIGIEEQLKWLSSEQCRQSKTVQRLNNWSLAHTLDIAKQIVNGKRRTHRPLGELQKQNINKLSKHIDPRPVTKLTLTSHQAPKRCGEHNSYTMKPFAPTPIQPNARDNNKMRPDTTPKDQDQITNDLSKTILRCKNPILFVKSLDAENVRNKENGDDEMNKKRKRMESHSNPIDKIKLHTFNFGELNTGNDTEYDDNRIVPYKQINKIQPITHIQYKTSDIANVAKEIISRNRERNIMNIHQLSTKMVDFSDIQRPKSTKFNEYTPIPIKLKNKGNGNIKRIKDTDVITNSMMLLQKYQTKLRVYSNPSQNDRTSRRYTYLSDTKPKLKGKESTENMIDYNVAGNESLQDIFFGVSRW